VDLFVCVYRVANDGGAESHAVTQGAVHFGSTVNGGSIGTWTTSSTNGSNVLTYTAPSLSNFPNPIPIISFIATADADHKKTGTGQVGLDSGIRVSITPLTATVPVGITPAQTASFNASLLNTNPSTAVFKLVQPNTASTNVLDQSPNPLSDTCTVTSPTTTIPGCGSIDPNGVYTAPIALPTDTVPAGSKSISPTTVVCGDLLVGGPYAFCRGDDYAGKRDNEPGELLWPVPAVRCGGGNPAGCLSERKESVKHDPNCLCSANCGGESDGDFRSAGEHDTGIYDPHFNVLLHAGARRVRHLWWTATPPS